MKVLVIQEEGASRDQLVAFLKEGGAEVVCSRPVWPGFFLTAKEERPDVAIVDCSGEPSHGRECAGYLGETGFTNRIKVFAINLPVDQIDRLKRRAPHAKVVNVENLKEALQAIDPSFGAEAPADA